MATVKQSSHETEQEAFNIAIIVTYAPTSQNTEGELDKFFIAHKKSS